MGSRDICSGPPTGLNLTVVATQGFHDIYIKYIYYISYKEEP